MIGRLEAATRAATVVVLSSLLLACGPLADLADMALNQTGTRSEDVEISSPQQTDHNRFMVVDLHADTLMWHRGLSEKSNLGQVDLARLKTGNVGLQIFTMVTRAPISSLVESCVHEKNFDPAALLAMASGWAAPTWGSPYQRALQQSRAFNDAVAAKRLVGIRNITDLESWLARRFPPTGGQDVNVIAGILGVEGAHAFNADLGDEFDTLVNDYGLRLVGPIHHFTNAYGQSSEACPHDRQGLTDAGRNLIRELFKRRMIVDLAHASEQSIGEAVAIARENKRPVLASHTGVRSHLLRLYGEQPRSSAKGQAISRAMSAKDIELIARTGGTTGIIYWKKQIGEAQVDNVVGAIMHAYCDLADRENTTPADGFRAIENASQHVSLGSDWDGAAHNAIDAAQVAAITARLRTRLLEDEVANILGRNACRVVAQSLSGDSFEVADALCSRYGAPSAEQRRRDLAARKARLPEVCRSYSKTQD